MEDKILNVDGLLAGPSVPTKSEAAEKDSILQTDSKDERTKTYRQIPPKGAKKNDCANPYIEKVYRKTQETMKISSQRKSCAKTLQK